MRKVWIVVANSSHAKIYKAENAQKLVEIKQLFHPESKLPNHELVSDKPGRATERFAYPHAYAEKTSPKLKEKNHFAEEIAHLLLEAHQKEEFERLYFICNPPFVAMLVEALDPAVAKSLKMEIHKDLTHLRDHEIREYLPPVM